MANYRQMLPPRRLCNVRPVRRQTSQLLSRRLHKAPPSRIRLLLRLVPHRESSHNSVCESTGQYHRAVAGGSVLITSVFGRPETHPLRSCEKLKSIEATTQETEIAGWEGRFTPAGPLRSIVMVSSNFPIPFADRRSGGKPPFPTCTFSYVE